MRDIIDGFLRFQREVYPQRVELFKQLATSQNPKALFVTCSDSRVVPELLTQREPANCSSSATRATSSLRMVLSRAAYRRRWNMRWRCWACRTS